ncbi:MAG: nitrous oxide-stimulated promoter family protein [Gammaproteobacteria bacterium]|nr:nitrous oxide-stimulated promoter family protein [Gammaproteobacteria bacterium]
MNLQTEEKHVARELLTITKMVGIYCSAHHDGSADSLCESCTEFMDYATLRLQKCPYGDDKPTCSNCPIHCYKPARRTQAKTIMRYAGPRMLLRHPVLAIAHKLDGFRKARHPRDDTRAERLGARKNRRQD